jgi:drug/metabolite transporter (DMT)-like permease
MPGSTDNLIIRSAPLIFVFFWSTGFIAAKYGLPYAEPLTFLSTRMALVVLLLIAIVALTRPRWPNRAETLHSVVVGLLVHGVYLGGVFVAISQGVPAGISALIPGLQPVLTSTLANRWLGEKVTPLQWCGLVLGLIGVLLVLNDRSIALSGTLLGWIAAFMSLFGITIGTLYQKRFCGAVDWRSGNLVQYIAAVIFFGLGAFLLETRVIEWTREFVFALAWSVIVLSICTVALMYWLIRRVAAAKVASLFYLVPAVTALMAWALFGEKLNALAIAGMVMCAGAVLLVNYRKA